MKLRRRKTILIILPALVLAAGIAAGLFFYRAVAFDPSGLATTISGGTIFTDRYGRELRFIPNMQGERLRWAALTEIPEAVRNAFIAAEDERFYQHHGFDGIAILRAAWSNLTKGKIVSGASTISQQVVRLVYGEYGARSSEFGPPLTQPSPLRGEDKGEGSLGSLKRARRTYKDKLIEIVRSVKMERMFSKDQILEQYLNRAPMGNNLVGVEAAARAYFGASVKNLSASEAALLASLPKAPGMLNPYGSGFERLVERRDWVLGRMEKLGMLTPDQVAVARETQPRLKKLAFRSFAPHIVDMLRQQNADKGILRTTLDLDLQVRLQEILASHAERLKYRGATQAAAIVIHNPTMEVLAAVGSLEYSEKNGGYNNGFLAERSAGSTLKPFLYALAIESGDTVSTLLEDTERVYRSREGQYSPLNFDRKEYGPVKMRAALGSSLNLSAVKMLQRVGEDRFYEMLAGLELINHPERGPEHYGLGMAIGNPEISPEQLATAYAMLANYGVYRPAKYVMNAVSPHPSRLTPHDKRYVLLPQTAYIVTDMLSDSTARMLTFSRSRTMMDLPFRAAIKTGTSTFFRDLWAVGYTPDYTVAVWVGNFDGSPTKNLSGSSAAAPLFADIIGYLHRRSAPVDFHEPRGIRRVQVCGYSGMKPTAYCTHKVVETFIVGSEPTGTCTFHTYNGARHELSASFAGWLYQKSRTGSEGRFRLSGFNDDLGTVFDDPGDSEALERAPGVRSKSAREPERKASKSEQATTSPRHYTIAAASLTSSGPAVPGEGDIRILYPLDRDRFVVTRPDRGRTIKLQAAVNEPVPYVEWFVNGRFYKRTGPPYQALWSLEQGRYRITAVTPRNIGDTVQVTVE
ncbi:MAG: transglycosylase domain-containing protein [Nitrospirota bacterium]|nr:transglycosylase domain-containing protein [Nitrospirota bacterium]